MRSITELEKSIRALFDLDPDKHTGSMRAAEEAVCILLALIPDPPPHECEWRDIQNAMNQGGGAPNTVLRVSRLHAAERGRTLITFYANEIRRNRGE